MLSTVKLDDEDDINKKQYFIMHQAVQIFNISNTLQLHNQYQNLNFKLYYTKKALDLQKKFSTFLYHSFSIYFLHIFHLQFLGTHQQITVIETNHSHILSYFGSEHHSFQFAKKVQVFILNYTRNKSESAALSVFTITVINIIDST